MGGRRFCVHTEQHQQGAAPRGLHAESLPYLIGEAVDIVNTSVSTVADSKGQGGPSLISSRAWLHDKERAFKKFKKFIRQM